MILELYINNKFVEKRYGRMVNTHGGFERAVGYLNQIHGLKNKRWYILRFDDKGHFKELYCPVKENLPDYITVPSIFP